MKLKPNKMQQTLGFRVREPVDWEEVKGLLDQLYAASGRLEALFPGRKFTLDGHLVGSVGEVIAAYMLDLDLARASRQGHDAFAPDRRQVEIKLTASPPLTDGRSSVRLWQLTSGTLTAFNGFPFERD